MTTPTTVKWEPADLDAGIPLVFRDFGHVVRAAYDPEQIPFEVAQVLLAMFSPEAVGAVA